MTSLGGLGVRFEHNKRIYSAGDVVRGCVHLELSKPMECTGVFATMFGKGVVEFDCSAGDSHDSAFYSRVYCNDTKPLWNYANVHEYGQVRTVAAGIYDWPFEFQLPQSGFPQTVHGHAGYVRYGIKAVIARHSARKNIIHTQEFTFLNPKNLNDIPGVMLAQHDETQKFACCWCCASGPILMEAKTDRSGYIPGDTIRTTVEIENNSSRRIRYVDATLVQISMYTGLKGSISNITIVGESTVIKSRGFSPVITYTHTEKMVYIRGIEDCGPKEVGCWYAKPLQVPNGIIQSGIEHFDNIEIEYCVQFKAVVVGTYSDVKITIPITIGTIPVRNVDGQRDNMPPEPNVEDSVQLPGQVTTTCDSSDESWGSLTSVYI